MEIGAEHFKYRPTDAKKKKKPTIKIFLKLKKIKKIDK